MHATIYFQIANIHNIIHIIIRAMKNRDDLNIVYLTNVRAKANNYTFNIKRFFYFQNHDTLKTIELLYC